METIQVAIRIRPFLPYENETNTTIDVSSEDDRQIQIQKGKKKFQGFLIKYFLKKQLKIKYLNLFHQYFIQYIKELTLQY